MSIQRQSKFGKMTIFRKRQELMFRLKVPEDGLCVRVSVCVCVGGGTVCEIVGYCQGDYCVNCLSCVNEYVECVILH